MSEKKRSNSKRSRSSNTVLEVVAPTTHRNIENLVTNQMYSIGCCTGFHWPYMKMCFVCYVFATRLTGWHQKRMSSKSYTHIHKHTHTSYTLIRSWCSLSNVLWLAKMCDALKRATDSQLQHLETKNRMHVYGSCTLFIV